MRLKRRWKLSLYDDLRDGVGDTREIQKIALGFIT